MVEFCPECGSFGFAVYIDERRIIKCLECGYRERVCEFPNCLNAFTHKQIDTKNYCREHYELTKHIKTLISR